MPRRLLVLGLILFCFMGAGIGYVRADEDSDKMVELTRQIEEYERQISSLQEKASTLLNQVAQFDAQIRLTELKIDQTEEQILLLGGRIDQLELSVRDLEGAFNSRAVETYRLSRMSDTIYMLLSVSDMGEVVSRYHYLNKIQEADRNLLKRLKSAKDTYVAQKGDLEELQQVLGVQKEELDGQKAAKSNLLHVTRNDEKKYQQLLNQAKAEFEAIQAIIAGRGDESEVGLVGKGDRIASVIQGPSCNSSGAHLHFMVVQNGKTQNPFSYLKPINYENCSGGGECSAADAFNPSGSWDWPISSRVHFNQGYGSTWAIANTWVGKIYSFHNGIDINSGDSTVRAVQGGTLYRGSYTGYKGCSLKYVRVDHEGSDLETFYLHINY